MLKDRIMLYLDADLGVAVRKIAGPGKVNAWIQEAIRERLEKAWAKGEKDGD